MIDWLVKHHLFRNENHAVWFLCTFGIFIFLIISILKPTRYLFLIIAVTVHIPPFITASYIFFQKKQSNLYSRDCIWFNGIMIVVYVILFAVNPTIYNFGI